MLRPSHPPAAPPEPPTSRTPSWAEQQRGTDVGIWRMTRIPALLLLGGFTISHLALRGAWVFVDHFNLLLHEAGHVFFAWAPDTLHILGGAIGQVMWPAFFAVYFWRWRREAFAAAVCVWWFGENLMNIARYMEDAIDMQLPLVGGGEHDWNTLLSGWHKLHRCYAWASRTRAFGTLFMLAGYAVMVVRTVRPGKDELGGPNVG